MKKQRLITDSQIARVKTHLKSKKSLRFCFVCENDNGWEIKELLFLPGYLAGVPQMGAGAKSVLIECGNCGSQLLLSAEKVGLV
jgi:hypothetical protein